MVFKITFPRWYKLTGLFENEADASIADAWLEEAAADWYVVAHDLSNADADAYYSIDDDGVLDVDEAIAYLAYRHAIRCLRETGLDEYYFSDFAYELSTFLVPQQERM